MFARLKYRPYRAVVALSRAIERQLVDAGVSRERVVLIPSGVDTQRYRPAAAARERLRAEFGLPGEALVVGVVAQLIERKRHSWLFALLPALVREWPGSKSCASAAVRSSAGCAPSSTSAAWRATSCSRVFARICRRCVPGLDLLVHPAGREGLGLALLEAASAGVPVVACAVGGVPDVVIDGETGVLVPRDDAAALGRALRALLAAPDERRRLGAAARRHVERRFDAARLVAAHHTLYTRVLAEGAAAAPVEIK